MYINIRSAKNKIDELEHLLLKNDIDIAALTETWLYLNQIKHFVLSDFNIIHSTRKSRGGGVALLIKKKFENFKVITEYQDSQHNLLIVDIIDIGTKVAVMYNNKEPTSINNEFFNLLDINIKHLNNALVIGDMNVNLLKNGSIELEYLNILKTNGYRVINEISEDKATRIDKRTGTKSILDHFVTNLQNLDCILDLKDHCISDHKLIQTTINFIHNTKDNIIHKQNYKCSFVNYDNLENSILNRLNEKNVNSFIELTEIIKEETEKATTTLYKRYTNNIRKGWYSKELDNLVKERDKLYVLHKKNPLSDDYFQRFKRLKKEVKDLTEKNKQAHLQAKFEAAEGSSSKQWKVISKALNNSKNKNTSIKSMKNNKNQVVTEEKLIANVLNDHFTNIAKNIKCNAVSVSDNQTTDENKANASLFLRKTTPEEVCEVIGNLKVNSAPGYDGIRTSHIKKIKHIIAPVISSLINEHIQNGTYPDELKVARITAIYKGNDKTEAINYRPISVLSCFSKIFEYIIKSRLIEHLTNNNLLTKDQNGFLSRKNTQSAVVSILEFVYGNLEIKNNVLAVFLDLAKAFDVVDHKILLKKLRNFGIENKAHDLFKSYLTNRKMYTVVNEMESDFSVMTSGVPQGSILGPFLFLIYINDITQQGLHGKLTLYADDTALFYNGRTEQIFEDAQQDLDTIFRWTCRNKIKLNEDKCKYILFKMTKPENYTLSINNHLIQECEHFKYLGLFLDKDLLFSEHIDQLINKLYGISYCFKINAKYFNDKTKFLIYNAFVSSILYYLAAFWGQARKGDLEKLQVVQNRLLKNLFRRHHRTHTSDLYTDLNLLNISSIIKLDSVKLVHKITNNLIDTDVNFELNNQIHDHNTRASRHIHILSTTSNLGRKRITRQAAAWYNSLPDELKTLETSVHFNKCTKLYFLNEQNSD